MERQLDDKSPGVDQLNIPRILPAVIECLNRLNAHRSEGIFRVPGEAEGVSDMRCRIDKSDYNFEDITDPNVAASLLKLWLRELSEPLIPTNFYDEFIKIGRQCDKQCTPETYQMALSIIESLPVVNKNVCNYLIAYLKTVAEPENQPHTRMSASNISMVFAPNFLRCPSDDPMIIFESTR